MGHYVADKGRHWPKGVVPYVINRVFEEITPHPPSTRTIAESVGRMGGKNEPADVEVVQELLNTVPPTDGGPAVPLVVDGKCGPKTKDAIQRFQLHHFGWPGADGRVDPDGPTLRTLNEYAGPGGKDIYADPIKGTILDAIKHWNEKTVMRLIPRMDQRDYVYFLYSGGQSHSEVVGKKPTGGRQIVYINPEALTSLCGGTGVGGVIHEIGHAVGLLHEAQRRDRNQHIKLNRQNLVEPACGFCIDPAVDPLPKCDTCRKPWRTFQGTPHGAYDLDSVMHYLPRQASSNGGITIESINPPNHPLNGSRRGLSPGDIATVKTMYG